jgi:hypothetical protein
MDRLGTAPIVNSAIDWDPSRIPDQHVFYLQIGLRLVFPAGWHFVTLRCLRLPEMRTDPPALVSEDG